MEYRNIWCRDGNTTNADAVEYEQSFIKMHSYFPAKQLCYRYIDCVSTAGRILTQRTAPQVKQMQYRMCRDGNMRNATCRKADALLNKALSSLYNFNSL